MSAVPSVVETGHAERRPRGLDALFFGTEPKLRMRVQRSMLSAVIYIAWMVIEAYCAVQGLFPWSAAWLIFAYNITGLVVFYALLRSGWSMRLRDPSLTLEQVIYSFGATINVYVLLPVTRAAALQLLCVILVFGMFTLKPREVIQACAAAVGLLLLTLVLAWFSPPPAFELKRESINVALACIILPALAAIIRYFAMLRETLLEQRAELKQAVERVQELATRDTLTGLVNRAHAMDLLDQEQRRHTRTGGSFCIALLDLDHFKRINDTHGHQVGDEVLGSFATRAIDALRQTDVVARWGGEEFLVLLPETTPESAMLGLERLRAAIESARLSASVDDLQVTVSGGIAAWSPGESLNHVLERADRALYAAKNGGRNRVTLAP